MKNKIAGLAALLFTPLFTLVFIAIGCAKGPESDINTANGSYRMYYYIESGFTCLKNGQQISTYKGKIGYDQKNYLVFGNGCSTSAETKPKGTPGFTVTDSEITYQGHTYTYMANGPTFP